MSENAGRHAVLVAGQSLHLHCIRVEHSGLYVGVALSGVSGGIDVNTAGGIGVLIAVSICGLLTSAFMVVSAYQPLQSPPSA